MSALKVFFHPDSSSLIACGAVFIPCCLLFTTLRFYTRHVRGLKLAIDDWLMIPACVFIEALLIMAMIEVNRGIIGDPAPSSDVNAIISEGHWAIWPYNLLHCQGLGFVKLSVIYLYRRIFDIKCTGTFHWLTVFLMVFVVCWMVTGLFANLFQCRSDIQAYWSDPETEQANCLNATMLFQYMAIPDAISDLLILVIPIPQIWRLQMSIQRKLSVTFAFLLGGNAFTSSMIRVGMILSTSYLSEANTLVYRYVPSADIYMMLLEAGVAFTAGNILVIYGLFRKSLTCHVRDSFWRVYSSLRMGSQQQRSSSDNRALRRADTRDSNVTTTNGTSTMGAGRAALDEFGLPPPALNGIYVTRSIEQCEMIVEPTPYGMRLPDLPAGAGEFMWEEDERW